MYDTHSHYDDKRFDNDRDTLLTSLFKTDIEYIINAGVDKETSETGRDLSEKYPNMFFAAGIHPHEAKHYINGFSDWMSGLVSHQKCVAVGEIGLDYHYDHSPRDVQMQIFQEQLKFAADYKKPVIIHDREAHRDCIETVLEHKAYGVFHSFSGSAETAAILQKNGWYISFSGIITFKNAEKTRRALLAVGDDRLLLETDCPYLTPHPHRGERNDSSYIKYMIPVIAELRGKTPEYIERSTTENAKNLFRSEAY